MAASKRPDSSTFPAGNQPQVTPPSQLLSAAGQPQPQAARQPASPARAVAVPAPARVPDYVDPALFTAGIFQDKAEYEATVQRVAAQIKRGNIAPRQPEADDEDTPIRRVPKPS